MKKDKKRFAPLYIILTILILVLIGALWFYAHKKETSISYPLGNKLEYIGKEDYGCYLLCDSKPASTYYYATDMDIAETIEYFKKSSLEQNPETTDGETYFGIKATNDETVYMYYYDDKNIVLRDNTYLKESSKSHILSVPSFKYQVAKDSL